MNTASTATAYVQTFTSYKQPLSKPGRSMYSMSQGTNHVSHAELITGHVTTANGLMIAWCV